MPKHCVGEILHTLFSIMQRNRVLMGDDEEEEQLEEKEKKKKAVTFFIEETQGMEAAGASKQLRGRDQHSDVTLVVENQKLHVHKALLILHSPVFEKMLTADFKERDLKEIPLPGKRYSVMVELLDQIYPGDVTDLVKDETLEDLLQLADEYDVQQVFINCRRYIISRLCDQCAGGRPSTDRILFYLGLVERYDRLGSLRDILIRRASQIPAQEMENSRYFLSVPATATRDALLQQIKSRIQYHR